MAFNQTELEIIKRGKELGKTRQDVEKAITNYRTGVKPATEKPVEQPGYLSRVASEVKGAYKGLQKTTERGAELMGEGKGVEGAFMSGVGATGAAVRTAFSPITAALEPVIRGGLEKSGILENEKVQEKLAGLDTWAKAHPDAAENLKNIFETGTALGGGKAVTAVAPTISRATKTAVSTGADLARTAGTKVAPLAEGTADLALAPVRFTKQTARNIKTNVVEKAANESAIKSLPTKTAQDTVRGGVDILDVKSLSKIPDIAKPEVKALVDNVVKFVNRESKTDPIDFVGKPVTARINGLEKKRVEIGNKLGEVAKSLGDVTTKEIYNPTLLKLRSVPGLQGLKINKDGNLDFSNTTLTTTETASDRNAIQSMFENVVADSTGVQKHNLRQELFEVLGGKQRSLAQMTDTQEKAYEAMRSALSDVLDTKNSKYKKLSNEYRLVVKPLQEIRKKLKASDPTLSEDILDMQAGTLARRLTGASMDRGVVENLLKQLDSATKKRGNVLEKTLALQDTLNILGRYYDIAPKTGFEGLSRNAIDTSSVGGLAMGAIKNVAGETPAVRQQALKKFLDEILTKKLPLQK